MDDGTGGAAVGAADETLVGTAVETATGAWDVGRIGAERGKDNTGAGGCTTAVALRRAQAGAPRPTCSAR